MTASGWVSGAPELEASWCRGLHALALSYVCVLLVTGCGNRERTVDIQEPDDVPFEVTWANRQPTLEDLFFLDEQTGWGVGWDGDVLYTDDGGEHWEVRASVGRALDRVFFHDRTNGWLAARNGEVLVTPDGGATWTSHGKAADESARSIQFFGGEGRVVYTHLVFGTGDGGATWRTHRLPDGFFCQDAHFVDAAHGWAVGGAGGIIATTDGGETWTAQNSGVTVTILSVFFLDRRQGWAATYNSVLRTYDGGATWTRFPTVSGAYFKSLQFADTSTGWATGNEGSILRTADGGRTWSAWHWSDRPAEWVDFKALRFVSRSRGWAAGDEGALVATRDGGITWQPQNRIQPPAAFTDDPERIVAATPYDAAARRTVRIPQVELDSRRYSVSRYLFANRHTGWALGTYHGDAESDPVGALFSTTDGGATWSVSTSPNRPDSLFLVDGHTLLLYTVPFFDGGGALYAGTIRRRAPSLASFAYRETSTGSIALNWRVRASAGEGTRAVQRLEVSQGTDQAYGPVDLGALTTAADGSHSLILNPADYGIDDGTKLFFRVTVGDSLLRYAHVVPESFVFRSWWTRQHAITRSLMAGTLLLSAYYSLSFLLLLLFPLGSIRIQQWLPLEKVVDLVPFAPVKAVLNRVLDVAGPRYFSTHNRARNAWLPRFRADVGALAKLPPHTLQNFLRYDAVCTTWLEHYRAGRCRFADLTVELRAEYIQRPACLDAWVERRAQAAAEAFDRLDAVRQRRICVPLPVRTGEMATGEYLNSPDSRTFRALLDRDPAVLAIIGDGGTGKSTLAFQLARWGLADNVETRLAPHRMIPVLVEEETADLPGTVRGLLTQMVGADETEADLSASLLAQKRLLVIVDGLSERRRETQAHITSVHRGARVGALVVTSRRQPDFGATTVTEVWPEKVTPATVFYFIAEYLRRSGVAELFPGRMAFELGERVLAVIESSGEERQVAPLFVTILVDQAVALRQRAEPLARLPDSLAETIIEHLRRTNPQAADVPNRVPTDTLIEAARVLGRLSLATHYTPRDVFRDDAEAALREHNIHLVDTDVIQRLVGNGIIEERTRGGTRIIRFTLDPIAEYMAALYWLNRLRDRRDEWQRWTADIVASERYPREMLGFLAALENCASAYGADLQIPELPPPLRASRLAAAGT